jgi:hypothetical protein
MIFSLRWAAAPLLLLSIAAQAAGIALPQSPEAAAQRMVTLNNGAALQTDEGKALLAGELEHLDSPGGGTLPTPDKVVRTGPKSAVARVPAIAGANPDLYLYLEEAGGGWRVSAIRSLALTGVLEEMIRLDAEAPSTDPQVRKAIRNAKLTLSSDRGLLAWAKEHGALFAQVGSEPLSDGLTQALQDAGANTIHEENGMVVISIGGILDNEVGFMLPKSAPVPAIDGRTYIWIEPAGDGWYLFKTT